MGAAWLWGAIGATDWVDGWWARKFDVISEFGKFVDPLTDRVALIVRSSHRHRGCRALVA